MSRDNLGNKQTIVIQICSINDKNNDLVITPHRQSVGYIKTKRQTLRKNIIKKNKNKLLGKDFQNEETQSQNQKQPQNTNFIILKTQLTKITK